MSEEKKISIDPALQNNCKCAVTVVETFVTNDGTSFFVIKNPNGQVIRLANTPEEVASFFCALTNLSEDEK